MHSSGSCTRRAHQVPGGAEVRAVVERGVTGPARRAGEAFLAPEVARDNPGALNHRVLDFLQRRLP